MLAEAQILRYSRQILLRAVGGAGQERLLQLRVGWDGQGAAAAVAIAYLASGGSGVEIVPDRGGPAQPGFLFGAPEPGTSTGPQWRQALAELNPDALSPGPRGAILSEAPFAREAESEPEPESESESEPEGESEGGIAGRQALLRLGAGEEGAVVLLAPAHGCRTCLEEACARLQPVPGAQATAAGALAALVLQRLALGLTPTEGEWTISPEGRIGARVATRCSRCG